MIFLALMPRLHLSRSPYDLLVCDFFKHHRGPCATTSVVTIHTGIIRFLALTVIVGSQASDFK